MCSNLFKTCSNVFKCVQNCSKIISLSSARGPTWQAELDLVLSAVPGPTWETDHCGEWGELVAKTTFAFIDQHHVGCVIIQTDAKSSCFGTSGQENQKTKCEGMRRETTFSKRTQHWGVGCRNVEIPHVWNKPAQQTNKQQQNKTLPKAQRTQRLSSTYQSNFFESYHKFWNKSW